MLDIRASVAAFWGAFKSMCLVALAVVSFVASIWVVIAVVCAAQNLMS
jgi:hypothetical protein